MLALLLPVQKRRPKVYIQHLGAATNAAPPACCRRAWQSGCHCWRSMNSDSYVIGFRQQAPLDGLNGCGSAFSRLAPFGGLLSLPFSELSRSARRRRRVGPTLIELAHLLCIMGPKLAHVGRPGARRRCPRRIVLAHKRRDPLASMDCSHSTAQWPSRAAISRLINCSRVRSRQKRRANKRARQFRYERAGAFERAVYIVVNLVK